MKLDHDDVEEFKQIYREEFGEELSDAEAERRGRQLLTFYEVIYGVLLKQRAGDRGSDGGSIRIDESLSPDRVKGNHPDPGG